MDLEADESDRVLVEGDVGHRDVVHPGPEAVPLGHDPEAVPLAGPVGGPRRFGGGRVVIPPVPPLVPDPPGVAVGSDLHLRAVHGPRLADELGVGPLRGLLLIGAAADLDAGVEGAVALHLEAELEGVERPLRAEERVGPLGGGGPHDRAVFDAEGGLPAPGLPALQAPAVEEGDEAVFPLRRRRRASPRQEKRRPDQGDAPPFHDRSPPDPIRSRRDEGLIPGGLLVPSVLSLAYDPPSG